MNLAGLVCIRMTIIHNASSRLVARLKLRVAQLQPRLPQQPPQLECQLFIYAATAPWLKEAVVAGLKAYVSFTPQDPPCYTHSLVFLNTSCTYLHSVDLVLILCSGDNISNTRFRSLSLLSITKPLRGEAPGPLHGRVDLILSPT